MAHQHRTTPAPIVVPLGRRRVGLEPQPYALHFQFGRWTADCTGCGYQLAEARRQDRCERKARTATCPICTGADAA